MADLREFWVQSGSVGELEIICRDCVDLIEPELSIGWSWPTVAQIVAAVDAHRCRRVIPGETDQEVAV
jgi:hypothetical protein